MSELLAAIRRFIRPGENTLRPEDDLMALWRSQRKTNPCGPYSEYNPGRKYNVKRRPLPKLIHTVTPIRKAR